MLSGSVEEYSYGSSLSPPPQRKRVTGSIPGDDTKICSDCLYSFVLKNLQQNAYGVVMVKKYKIIVRIRDITGTVPGLEPAAFYSTQAQRRRSIQLKKQPLMDM